MSEKTHERGTGQKGSTPPMRGQSDRLRERGDRHRVGEAAEVAEGGVPPAASKSDEAKRKKPQETEIERAQEDETNMGHPERPYT